MTTKRVDAPAPGFSEDDTAPASNLSSMQRAIVTIQKLRSKVELLERTRTEPIAIIGMACRFPGGANSPEDFFHHLEEGIDAITEVPADRWRLEPEQPTDPELRALRWGAFLHDIDRFDAQFFNISPREASKMDPQQRLLLEVTFEALERAGQVQEKLVGSRTGVFLGIMNNDYAELSTEAGPAQEDMYTTTGNGHCFPAGRVSYTFGFQGPSVAVDTACSSSLVALHLACQSLRNGECNMAVAGGVNLMLVPSTSRKFGKTQALSPDGRCKSFDATANGFVRGEGCGMIVLKRLSDAERDGDPIVALIRGSAINQDGRSTGLTAPNVLAQQAMLTQALANARVAAADIGYVETHGTGTPLGDPIEVEALRQVLGAVRANNSKCILGAVKTNIGHLEAAAGIAGVIKTALVVQRGIIPRNNHFRTLNPRIRIESTPFAFPEETQPWTAVMKRRIAGISSFGMSGTNAHVILEESPSSAEEDISPEDLHCLLPISARTPEALRQLAANYLHYITKLPVDIRLRDLIHSASVRRSHYVHRLSVVGKTKEEMATQLAAYLRGQTPVGVAEGKSTPARAKIVFVFSGQGSQWIGMGRQLYETDPSFRSVIDTCDNLMTSRLGWSILDELDAPEAASRLTETHIAQPLLFAVQIALVEMLRSWGISPDAMIGHSVGEIAAAHIAGILSLDEAIRLVAVRGRIMQKATGMGKMVAVAMTPEDAATMVAGYEDRVSIAAINDPKSLVIAGQPSAVDDVVTRCEKRGYEIRQLQINYAFHSPQMEPLGRELVERLTRVDARRATLAMYSTVLAECVDGKELDAQYWGNSVHATVDFAGAVNAAIRDGYQLFLEVGPHPELTKHVRRCLVLKNAEGHAVGTLRHGYDDRRALLETAGGLYTLGCTIEWARILPVGGRCIPLPTYPWQRERFWLDESNMAARTTSGGPALRQEKPISRAKTVFVFPGQGSQWLGMGQELLAQEPVFRETLEACDAAIGKEADFSVLAELQADELTSRLEEIDVVQPLLFAIEVALAKLWESKGIKPDCVVGHSMGEIAAAHIAGILSLEDAARVICRRSRLLTRIQGLGAMALVELPMNEAEEAISSYQSKLGVAVSNGPRATVISGDAHAINEVLATLEARGVYCKHVKVDIASHSPQVDPLLADLRAVLRDIKGTSQTRRMQSTVTNERLEGNEVDATYWASNLRQPVRFSEVTQSLLNEGFDVFIEMSPHPVLVPAIEENIKETKGSGLVLASMRRQTPEQQTLSESLGAVVQHRRQAEAIASVHRGSVEHSRHGTIDNHPLLGWRFTTAAQPDLSTWEFILNTQSFPYLESHRVQDEVVFPAAGFVEMTLAAGSRVFNGNDVVIDDISFVQMLALSSNVPRSVQFSLVEEGGNRGTFTISSRPDGTKDWVQHVSGALHATTSSGSKSAKTDWRVIEKQCPERVSNHAHYERMQARGLGYGPEFQGVSEICVNADEVLARISIPDSIRNDVNAYLAHPALLDACFQATLWSLSQKSANLTYVPTKVKGLHVHDRLEGDLWVHARAIKLGEQDAITSLVIGDLEGRILLNIEELHLQALAQDETQNLQAFSDCIFETAWQKADLVTTQKNDELARGPWLVLLDAQGTGSAIAEQLRMQSGTRVVEAIAARDYAPIGADRHQLDPTNLEHWNKLLTNAFGKAGCGGVVHCGALDAASWSSTTESTLAADLRRGPWSVLRLTQALLKQGWRDTPKLYALTRGAQTVVNDTHAPSAIQSTIWGLGRVMTMEQPDLGCVRIDLPPEISPDEPLRVVQEFLYGGDEDQIALRHDGRYVERLVRGSWKAPQLDTERHEPANGRPFQLTSTKPGILDRLSLYPLERRPPGPLEVEIEVEAAGLNFLDVMKAMNIYPGMDAKALALGVECSGRIVAIGDGVTGFHLGQEVVTAVPSSLSTHVTAAAKFVIAKPSNLSFEEAATIPAVFMTAYWALRHLGRLGRNERILIHAATGGTGLAALQYARAIGAEVFATAGSNEKRAYLQALGIEHVLDSRSLSFADEIMKRTNGRGVDVVLNSLTGDAAIKGLEVLAPYGRFLELGKKDIYQNARLGLSPFRKSISYSAIDLMGMREDKPELYANLLREVFDEFAKGTFRPLPVSSFPVGKAADAFQYMAQARHIGKIALQIKDPQATLAIFSGNKPQRINSEGTYVITGGLGGLGLTLARGLAEKGAKHLALIGRSAPNETANAAIRELMDAGVHVRTYRADIAKRQDVTTLFASLKYEMPQIRGIVHAAGVLEDRTIEEMTEVEFFRPMEPKVFGAWNLHEATRKESLDFFVVYSSIAGVLGTPGQANYAAANTFLDALSYGRATEGLPATSVQWGAFADVGLAAAQDVRGKRLAARGSASFKPEDEISLFSNVIAQPRAEIGLMHFDARQWIEFYPQVAGTPFLSELTNEKKKTSEDANKKTLAFIDTLTQTPPAQRVQVIEAHLLEQLGKVLRYDPKKIDKRSPFVSLGMDSLMSLELRNRLEASLGIKLSAALLFTYSTIVALAGHLVGKLFATPEPEEPAPATLRAPTGATTATAIASKEVAIEMVAPEEPDLVDKLEAFEEYLK